MDRIEIINKLNEMKDVLMERGWTKTRLEDPDGSVCLLGARNLVMYGESLYNDSMTGGKDGYCNDELTVALFNAFDMEYIRSFYPDREIEQIEKESPNLVYLFNDSATTGFNEVIELIDAAIIIQKDKIE